MKNEKMGNPGTIIFIIIICAGIIFIYINNSFAYNVFSDVPYQYSTGSAFTGNDGQLDCIWGNPAGLYSMQGAQLQFNYGSFFSELEDYGYSPQDIIISAGVFLESLKTAVAGSFASRSISSVYTFNETRLSFGFKLFRLLKFGIGLKYSLEEFSELQVYNSAFGIEAGILMPLNENVNMGFLSSQIDDKYLNRLGLNIKIFKSFNGLLDYEFGSYTKENNIYLGIVYIISEKLVLNVSSGKNMLSFGVRLLGNISVKYAYITYTDEMNRFGSSNIFGVTLQLNKIIPGGNE